MIRTLKAFFKIIMAGITAIIILSLILSIYSLTPVHIKNPNQNTDYIWPANAPWIKMTEGISYGKFDGNGYNNLFVIDDPDILILGSSHMEATNLMQTDTLASVLNKKFDGQYKAYNKGISGHDFVKVCQYIPNNLDLYEIPPKVVIIEAASLTVSEKDITDILNHTVDYTPSYDTGILALLQKIPFIRVLYQQIEGGLLTLFKTNNTVTNTPQTSVENSDKIINESVYEELFLYLHSLEEKYNTKIIIFYHPMETLQGDGSIQFNLDENLNNFTQAAKKNNVTFIDMSQSFKKMYYEQHYVAHGFSTGELGIGHLNAHGQSAIADRIYSEIQELKKDGNL